MNLMSYTLVSVVLFIENNTCKCNVGLYIYKSKLWTTTPFISLPIGGAQQTTLSPCLKIFSSNIVLISYRILISYI